MVTTASILTEQMTTPDGRDLRTGNPGAIYALITDGPIVHCMTEDMIDEWFRSLAPADKAEIHERWLDADPLDEADVIELALQTMRNPVDRIYTAATALAARNVQPFTPDMPTFSSAEIAHLQRCARRRSA